MIHKYKWKDRNIALDVNSGAVYEVNELTAKLMDEVTDASQLEEALRVSAALPEGIIAEYGEEAVKEALGEMRELVLAGALFSEETFTKEEFERHGERVVKAMCLHVAHDCNMDCRYCFAGQGAFEGERSMMSFETGKRAVDYLLEHSAGRHNLEIDFFGGEPLLNFEVVKQLVDYGAAKQKEYDKHIRFTITTNGLLLDEDKTAFINEHMDNVILSIDGRPEVNDRMRSTRNGKGTHDLILQNYLDFVKKRKGLYYVRGTFTRENMDFSEDVKYLLAQGFQNISVEPVVTGPEHDFAVREADLPRILAEYERLADEYIEKAHTREHFDFFHFNVDLEQGPCVVKRLSGCGAGSEYMAVSPEGDLYPCHQFVGNPVFLMGNLYSGEIKKEIPDLAKATIWSKPDCAGCWAKYYCSGGCHANAWNMSGDVLVPYKIGCEMEKKRIECAIGARIQIETIRGE